MRRSGLGDAPRTVLEELSKIKSGDVVLPTGTKEGHYNGTVRLRCATEPDEAKKVLLHRLGITLPRRRRRINEFAAIGRRHVWPWSSLKQAYSPKAPSCG